MTPWQILEALTAEQFDVALAYYRVRHRREEQAFSVDNVISKARQLRAAAARRG